MTQILSFYQFFNLSKAQHIYLSFITSFNLRSNNNFDFSFIWSIFIRHFILFNIHPHSEKQETEKVLALHSQLDQEQCKKNNLLSELSLQSSEVAHMKAKEMQLVKEVQQFRETKRRYEDDLVKIKNAHNNDVLQVILKTIQTRQGFPYKDKEVY